ncbi:sigma-70 family RNA polymerase sigma factor [Nocardioides sp. URHA0032]|uniref:sigma-70 family RNA polymerase sigma factor n=1 Tax=Nocardioides sp. URHA0032 TaxID=1380388 RepID=UPI0012DDF97D|nr:sigma-70 family RNA polymerase sigma factor [Nocardioides sp. URHA0032]
MKDPDEFDQFYQDVRDRLLVLTYCLTGDLPSSRAAVRDAFVVAWHHWRKVSKLEDPEAWTRVRACAHAQRRHTAKLWHREKGLDPEVKATLDALGKLPLAQRRVLLLTELSTASMAEIAREAGLPRTDAERALQTAASQFALARDVPTTGLRSVFEPVRAHVVGAGRWPRATIIRRAGATRRRTHTVIGTVATVAALVVTGTLVSDAAGVRPTLTGERVEAGQPHSKAAQPTPEPADLPEEALLVPEQVSKATPGRTWTLTRTDDNSAGSGIVMPCQGQRYADPRGTAALVRTFDPMKAPKAAPAPTAVQTVQASASEKAANRGYATALGWFAGCHDDRAQLVGTHTVGGVGDDAMLLVLRTWDGAGSSLVAGVARTGELTTTTLTRTPVGEQPSLQHSARLLADAVSGLCNLQDAGSCAFDPVVHDAAPVPAAPVPAMLAEVDLPPVTGVDRPWVGTEPRQARSNAASTGCDQTDFSGTSNNVTRTFLVPGADLPDQFGLTETVGSLPAKKAAAFVDAIRADLAKCSDKQMGTEVTPVRKVEEKGRDVSVWHVSTEISDHQTVEYLMGVARDGTSIAQVGFVPAPKVGFAPGAFVAIVDRALARLDAMPPPKG